MAKIALAQMTSGDDVAQNLEFARSLVPQAAEQGAQLLAYPEVFLFLGGRRKKLAAAQALDGPLVSEFQELAARHQMMILMGSLHERIPGNEEKLYNTAVLLGSDGEILSVYRKMRLFDVELPHLRLKESDTIVPGETLAPVVETPIGKIGLTICFDLRFSPLYLELRRKGAEIILVPSNFTAPTGQAHWEVMLRARAIENQVYIAAPAQAGVHNPKYTSHGHSMVVDPWGKVVTCMPAGTGLCFADTDLDLLRKVRAELPMNIPAAEEEVDSQTAARPASHTQKATAALDL